MRTRPRAGEGAVDEPTGPARFALLAAIASGTLLNPLNSSMIAVALVDFARSFRLDFSTVSWLISAFYVASAVGQPLSGRLSDLYGRRRVFMGGLALVGASSVAAPFSPGFAALVAVRVVQALGSSALYPAGIGIVQACFRAGRARALAVVSVFSSVSAGVGPTLGGYLVGWHGWRTIFVVNLPIVAASLVSAAALLPADPPRPRISPAESLRRLDPVGGGLFALTLVCLLWFLLSLGRGVAWWALPAVLAGAASFAAAELRRAEPFLDLRALGANRALLAVYGQFALVNVVFYSIFFGLPSFLQEAKGLSAERAGLVMLTVSGLGVVTTPLAARGIEAFGVRPVLATGACFMVGGSLALLAVRPATGSLAIAGLLAVPGVSNGLNNLGLQAAMVAAAPPGGAGTASGLFQTSRYLGTILAASLLGLAFGQRIDVHRLHVLAVVLAAVSAMILTLVLRSTSLGAQQRA